MANKKVYRKSFSEEFRRDCTVINLESEYPDHVGQKNYLVLTDLPENEVRQKYAAELEKLGPHVIWMRSEMVEIMNDYNRNEAKHRSRMEREEDKRNEAILCGKGYREPAEQGFEYLSEKELEEMEWKAARMAAIKKAFHRLPGKYRHRLILRVWHGFTYNRIGDMDGISARAAEASIKRAMERLRRYYYEELADEYPLEPFPRVII